MYNLLNSFVKLGHSIEAQTPTMASVCLLMFSRGLSSTKCHLIRHC